MGHYDDCYEEDAARQRKADAARHREGIHKQVDELNLEELEFIHKIMESIESYRTFFSVLRSL